MEHRPQHLAVPVGQQFVTGHSWKYFVQKYDLEWLVAALTVLLIVGVVLLVWERRRTL